MAAGPEAGSTSFNFESRWKTGRTKGGAKVCGREAAGMP